jgi:hypothetical protein
MICLIIAYMARKNISIGVDTWNDLSSLGRFGMTFDDIIKILLRQSKELRFFIQEQKESENKPPVKEFGTSSIIYLPAIKFPANKDEIINCALDVNTNPTIDDLKELPDQQYKDKGEIEKALVEVVRYKGFTMFDRVHKGLYKVVVDDRVLDEEQKRQRQEKVRELNEVFAEEFEGFD